jgi:hypothetical protein
MAQLVKIAAWSRISLEFALERVCPWRLSIPSKSGNG